MQKPDILCMLISSCVKIPARLTFLFAQDFSGFRKYMLSHGPRTLYEGPETPTQWKSKSVTDQPTYWLG